MLFNGEKLGKIITGVKKIVPNHLSFKNKKQKENIVRFPEGLGRDAKRQHSDPTHTKEVPMKKSAIAVCRSSF